MSLAKVIIILVYITIAVVDGREYLATPLELYSERSITSEVIKVIEDIRDQMPCGFPGLGIPPLAPLKLEHEELDIDGAVLKVQGEINDFYLYGTNEFEIVEFHVSPVVSRVTFKFHWPRIYTKTEYDMALESHVPIVNNGHFKMDRHGNATFTIKDFLVWGNLKYSLGIVSGNIRVKQFKLYISLGEVISEIENLSPIKFVNRKLNEIIEETVMLIVNENTENVADITNSKAVPIMNDLIGDMSIGDLLGLIGGGGGDDKEPCIPSELY